MADFSQTREFTVPPEMVAEMRYRGEDATKIRTRNTIEQLCHKTGMLYQELFGQKREMKALQLLMEKYGVAFTNENDRGNLLLEMANLRSDIADENRNLDQDEIDLLTREWMAQRYIFVPNDESGVVDWSFKRKVFPPLDQEKRKEITEVLNSQKDDNFLYIGDPFEYINRKMDKKSTYTVENSPGNQEAIQSVRTLHHVVGDINERYDRVLQPSLECEDWLGPYDEDEESPEFDKRWFYDLDSELFRAIEETKRAKSPEEINESIEKWQKVKERLTERKTHYKKQGVDVTRPHENYDTDFGLGPLDELSKHASNMANTALEDLMVLSEIKDIIPGLISKYIEHIADAHLEPSPHADEGLVRQYRDLWNVFIESKGFNPETYDIYDEKSRFVDLLMEFIQSHGSGMIDCIDPYLFYQIRSEEEHLLSQRLPYKNKAKNAKLVIATYPDTSDKLPADFFDNILASWSVTAHAMPHMSESEIVNVWDETIRTLRSGGIATFYPIGHYGNSQEEIKGTLEKLKQKGHNFTYRIFKASDERFLDKDDFVLVLEKA